MNIKKILASALFFGSHLGLIGCWDVIEHHYDYDPRNPGQGLGSCSEMDDGGTGTTALDTGSDDTADTGTAEEDLETQGQGIQIPGWEGFGRACETNADCTDLPDGQCIHNIMDIIHAPRGFCSACCNKAGIDICAAGIDCVGLDDNFTICINTCFSDDQCREGYECKPVPYLNSYYQGRNYCMPDAENAIIPEGVPATEPDCDWPWLEEQ